ncbi:MAG: 1-acyl-sn-glycerol-3-phosphate acyltransferase [Saprospiraceae bacterium]|jgi:glycerol-3-phosphate O-acyltransferase|nr:1-acyl-sn-glycerol-3-phosphate acyltransferase [Saprospiraceae bacterium]
MEKKTLPGTYPPILPDINDWPIFKLSEDRKTFTEELEHFTLDKVEHFHKENLTDLLAETIYLEKIRIKEEPWKVDPPNERQFWSRIKKRLVKYSVDKDESISAQNNTYLLKQIIHRYALEIVGTFRINTFLFARKFLTWFFNQLLQASFWKIRLKGGKKRLVQKLLVKGDIDHVRSLAQKGTLIIVPTHFSNLDSILIGYVLDAVTGLPAFSYGAGLNLYNTGYTAYFMNRLGAYRVDRRKKNKIYLETLKSMSSLSIQRGTNSIFFPGGTRSRSGAIENKLKMGLLGTVVEAQRAMIQRNENTKIYIVPLILSYHFVLDGQSLIDQYLKQQGKSRYFKEGKDYSGLSGIIRFIWKILSEGNEITLSFGKAMDVIGNPVDQEGNSKDKYGNTINMADYFISEGKVNTDIQRETEYTGLLAENIIKRFHSDNIVLSSHLLAFAAFEMICNENPKLDLFGILRLPTDDYIFDYNVLSATVNQLQKTLIIYAEKGKLILSPEIKSSIDELIADGIKHLGTFHIKKPLKKNKSGEVISENFYLLYFYHNRLTGYGLEKWIKPGRINI